MMSFVTDQSLESQYEACSSGGYRPFSTKKTMGVDGVIRAQIATPLEV